MRHEGPDEVLIGWWHEFHASETRGTVRLLALCNISMVIVSWHISLSYIRHAQLISVRPVTILSDMPLKSSVP